MTRLLAWALAAALLTLLRPASAMERLQANAFVESDRATMAQSFSLWRSSVTEAELQATISLCFLFRGLSAANRGAEILANIAKREADAAAAKK